MPPPTRKLCGGDTGVTNSEAWRLAEAGPNGLQAHASTCVFLPLFFFVPLPTLNVILPGPGEFREMQQNCDFLQSWSNARCHQRVLIGDICGSCSCQGRARPSPTPTPSPRAAGLGPVECVRARSGG